MREKIEEATKYEIWGDTIHHEIAYGIKKSAYKKFLSEVRALESDYAKLEARLGEAVEQRDELVKLVNELNSIHPANVHGCLEKWVEIHTFLGKVENGD